MKLYQTYTSPFPTRVRLVLYAKGIEAEIIEPPGFHSSAESKGDYLAINPIGRVPTLVLDDGRALPESEVICEYLEDAFPDPPLRLADPFERAQARLIARLCDFYLVMAMVPLFNASAQARRDWRPEKIDSAFAEIRKALGYLELHIGDAGYAVGPTLTHADGALTPQLVLSFEWAPALFDRPSPLGEHPRLARYWAAIQKDPIAARLIAETREAIAGEQARAKAASRR
ncbi:MAG TPA: glutathione S-transferase family protein [Caulobacteraceae bacterium]